MSGKLSLPYAPGGSVSGSLAAGLEKADAAYAAEIMHDYGQVQ